MGALAVHRHFKLIQAHSQLAGGERSHKSANQEEEAAAAAVSSYLAELERPAVPLLHHPAVIFGMSDQMPVVCIVIPCGDATINNK